ncbi:MAG: salt stress protein, Slr1339 family [Microcystaceae cyanobacterium]
MGSLNKLLADLDALDKPNLPQVEASKLLPKKLISSEQLLADLEAIAPSPPQNHHQKDPNSKPKSPNLDNLLSQVKSTFEQQELAQKQAKELELSQQKLLAQKQALQAKVELKTKAEEWLNKLETLSTEGIWFTAFAQNYPSVLEAAMDYLEASEKASRPLS